MQYTNLSKRPFVPTIRGFTLIEISIVLVIIGLIMGGILVGRSMIEAAQLRNAISQIESYETAINTFRLKYNTLPGDMTNNSATMFGFVTRPNGLAQDNGIFDSCALVSNNWRFGCEVALIWRDLSEASLIGETFNSATDNLISATATQVPLYFPASKLSGNYITVFSPPPGTTIAGHAGSFFGITGIQNTNSFFGPGFYTPSNGLRVISAFQIDAKMDDGLPTSGRVWAMNNGFGSGFDYVANGICANAGGTAYKTDTVPNTSECKLMIKIK